MTPAVTADAPGRVNLIGEHTDYNGGFVLPLAILERTRVSVSVRDDDEVRVVSDAYAEHAVRYRLGNEATQGDWADYVRGCTWALRAAGHALRGFDTQITSDVPVGAGLSSSAALEVAVLRAVRAAFALRLDDVGIAGLAHRAEAEFVGAPVGIMDQMAASLADGRAALFLDCRTHAFERIGLPEALEIRVIHSGITHRNVDGGYPERRGQCDEAARLLGVAQLRDASVEHLHRLPPLLARRARHVVTENARVVTAVAALKAGDLEKVGTAFDASHASQRDDFAVSLPEIDLLVDLVRREPGVLGARLTGGGFGGSIVVATRRGHGDAAVARAAEGYTASSGRTTRVFAR